MNGEVFDLDRVLEGDCSLEFLNFDDDEGNLFLWPKNNHLCCTWFDWRCIIPQNGMLHV